MSHAERNGTGVSLDKPSREDIRIAQAERIIDEFMPNAVLFFQVASGHRDTPLPQSFCSDLRCHLIKAALRHKPLYGPLKDYLYRNVNQFLMRLQVEAFLAGPVDKQKKV